jgi:hypothetical protein
MPNDLFRIEVFLRERGTDTKFRKYTFTSNQNLLVPHQERLEKEGYEILSIKIMVNKDEEDGGTHGNRGRFQ